MVAAVSQFASDSGDSGNFVGISGDKGEWTKAKMGFAVGGHSGWCKFKSGDGLEEVGMEDMGV